MPADVSLRVSGYVVPMPSLSFAIIPVVAVQDGKSTYPPSPGSSDDPESASPLEVAKWWSDQGAQRIQVIDVDSVANRGRNPKQITELVHGMRNRARIDLWAGVYESDHLNDATKIGPTQIVLATSTVADQDFLKSAVAQHGKQLSLRLVIGEDGSLHAPGTAADGLNIWEQLPDPEALGIPHFLVIDAGGSGHWWSRHKSVLETFCQTSSRPVTAGSGVDSLENLHELCELVPQGLDGAVVGKALLDGAFTYAEAQTAVEARYDPYEWGPAQP